MAPKKKTPKEQQIPGAASSSTEQLYFVDQNLIDEEMKEFLLRTYGVLMQGRKSSNVSYDPSVQCSVTNVLHNAKNEKIHFRMFDTAVKSILESDPEITKSILAKNKKAINSIVAGTRHY